MEEHDNDDWSPADFPYSIAVTESQFAWRGAALTVMRMHDPNVDRRTGFDSRQLDARTLIGQLHQLLKCEELEQHALAALGIAPAAGLVLAAERDRFEQKLPGLKEMRDAQQHFDEWSRGQGRGPQRQAVLAGADVRDVARLHWGFGYDPQTDMITFGTHTLNVALVERAAYEMANAIYMAAREVDAFNRLPSTTAPAAQ